MSLRGLRWDLPRRSQAHALELPGRAQAAADGARPERVKTLAKPRAGGVIGGGDAHVVAAVVLDEEVPVGALGERDLGEPALGAGALVSELVGGVDRDAGDHPHRECQPDVIERREFAARPQPAREDQPGVLDRDVEIGTPTVVTVLLEPLDHAVGWVGRVRPDGQVEEGKYDKHQEWAIEPEDPEAGRFDQGEGEEWQRGND